ncbi:MAG: beta-L-arabinofuranosidase domain-containing protein [Povalibacter sp.]
MQREDSPPDVLRRRVVQALGIAAFAGETLVPSFAATDTPSVAKVRAFPLSDVRLGDGPFLDAQRRDERYLLQLQPDRLLHNFRVNAGLEPKAAVYGGWESQEPWVDIRCHGHTLGHYLSACSLMFASTGYSELKQRVDYIVDELAACQAAAGTALVCAFPDGAQPLVNSVQGKEFAGVPWYTMHKVLAGLRDAYLHAGNERALAVFSKLADALGALIASLSDAHMQKMLEREHGGMNEVFADLSQLTHQAKYLEWAEKFSHRAILEPLSQGRDMLDGLHSNTQIPKVIGFMRIYELSGREDHRRAAEFFWKTIIENRTYATGGNGDGEHFFPPREFVQRLSSAKTMETCCTHNMLRLTRALYTHDPAVAFVDHYERALFNAILGSQDPDTGMMTYFQATRPGYVKLYCTPTNSFWCCTGSGMENHAKYGDSIYFHDDAGVYVNLFIASRVHWREKHLHITQATSFPEAPRTQLTIEVEKPTSFTIRIRQPNWSSSAAVRINGEAQQVHRTAGNYIALSRTWKNGDRIEMDLDMQLRLEPLPTSTSIAAMMYGPIVLAGRLGRDGITPGADLIVNERKSGEMLNIPRELPKWKLNRDRLADSIQRDSKRPLVFYARGVSDLPQLELIPYSAIAHERYNLYWNLV